VPGTFDDLPADDQRLLRQLGAFRRHHRGTYLMLEGDRTDHALFICSGRIKIVRTSDDGRESVIAVREAGELVGELNALAGSSAPRAASVVALSDVTVRSIPATELLRLAATRPAISFALMRALAVRLREATERQAEAAGYDSLRRVARVLVSYAERDGETVDGGGRQVTGLTQSDLAGLVATSPTSVARALAALRSRGLVTTSRRSVAIPDLEAMRRFIG
jgi:CRP-like cAMP-binding protein